MKKVISVMTVLAATASLTYAAPTGSLSSQALQKHVQTKTKPMFDRMYMDAGRVQEFIKENARLPKNKTISFQTDVYDTYNMALRSSENGYAVVSDVKSGPLKGVNIVLTFEARSLVKLYDTTSFKCYTNVDGVVAGETVAANSGRLSALLPQCTYVSSISRIIRYLK